MASLNGQTIASSYEQLLHVDRDGGGNANTLVSVKDGDNGTTFGIKLATNKVEIIPGSNDTNAFEVSQADGTAVLTVDSTNAQVGISEASPDGKLHIKQATDNGNAIVVDSSTSSARIDVLTVQEAGAERWHLSFEGESATNSLMFASNSTGHQVADGGILTLLPAGNVGVNSSSPDEEFEIFSKNGGNDVGIKLRALGTSSTAESHVPAISFQSDQGDGVTARASISADRDGGATKGKLIFKTRVSDNITTVMSLDSSGNQKLHNNGLIITMDSDTANANGSSLQRGSLFLNRDDTATIKQLRFYKAGSEHSYLETSTDGLKIGDAQTTFGGDVKISKSSAKLTVFDTTTGDKEAIVIDRNTASNGDSQEIRWKLQGSNYPGGYILHEFVDANNSRFAFGTRQSGTPATALLINESGNVGIGETSPSTKLHVKNDAQAFTALLQNNNGDGTVLDLFASSSDDHNDDAIFRARTDAQTLFQIFNNGNTDIDGNLTVNNAGSSSNVTVDGNTGSGNDGTIIVKGHTSSNSRAYIYFNNGATSGGGDGWFLGALRGANGFALSNVDDSNSGTNVFTVTASDKHLGIGTSTPTYRVDIEGDENTWLQSIVNTATSGNAFCQQLTFAGVSPNNVTSKFQQFVDGGSTVRFEVRSNGGVASFQSNDADLSDESVKKDIADAPSCLETVNNIKVRNFKYKDQTDNRTLIGVIAQEVEAVDSSLVDDSEELKRVYNKDIMFMMLKSIQELSAKVTELENKLGE